MRLLLRSPQPSLISNPQLTTHLGDLSQPDTLRDACQGVDFVIHLAAMLHVNNPSAELHDLYRRVNVIGTQKLVEDALRHRVQRFVFASTVNVYGASRGRVPFTEDASLNPDSIYAETKISAEDYVRGEIDHVILRLAAVYGRQMNGNYPRMVRAISKRRFPYIGDGSNRRALIHERDVAAGISLALRSPAALNETFNLTDGEEHTLHDIVEAIAVAQGVAPPSIHLPARPLRAALGATAAVLGAVGVRTPLSPLLVDKMIEDVAVSNQKFRQNCLFKLQMNLLDGWADACQVM